MGIEVITTAQMYWLTRMSSLHSMTGLVSAVSFVSAALLLIVGFSAIAAGDFDPDNDVCRSGRRIMRNGFIALAVCMFFCVCHILTPTTKELAAIIIVPKIANSEKVQTVGNKVYDLAVEWMEELKPDKEERK